MWLKLLGSSLVLFVSSYIGFQFATRCSQRPEQIRQIVSCLGSLKSYITYACLPLNEALRQCTHGTKGPIADVFHKTAQLLEENGLLTPQQALTTALHYVDKGLFLGNAEVEVLGVLGANLGTLHREEQGHYLLMIMEQLEKIESEATRIRDLNTKMYRYLGICSGLAIVILLV